MPSVIELWLLCFRAESTVEQFEFETESVQGKSR